MKKPRGFSLIELLIVVAIILIIAAIAVPNLMKSRQKANDASAASTLRTLHTSEATYNIAYGPTVGFANSLSKLGPGSPCDATHACLIDSTLGCSTQPCLHSGYNFFLSSTQSSPPFQDYTSTATPLGFNSSGTKNFCSSEDGMVRYELTATASVSSAIPHSQCTNFAIYDGI